MKGLLGKKIGMTQIFTDAGEVVPVTVVEAGPCPVLACRTQEHNGYSALQLGFGKRKLKNISRGVRGHIADAGLNEHGPACVREIRLKADPEENVGDVLFADIFTADEFVDIVGVTKGRGFQGVIKRYRFAGGRASHGGDWTRRGGSIGCCVDPGKVYKGKKMPGQMGNVRRTVQNLKVVQVRKDENLLLIKGAIPGPNGRQIIICEAKKRPSPNLEKE
jgi:large subunit ribosomal protein L3